MWCVCAQPPTIVATGFITLILWLASLFSFSFASAAAACSGNSVVSFIIAGSALALGALFAGVLSDRWGRISTARLLFSLGTLASCLAALIPPGSTEVILTLVFSAGIASGGSHVAAELFLELVPHKYRAFALLCFPVMFFPVGMIAALLRGLGWYGGAALTACVCAMAGCGLYLLPESSCFERVKLQRSKTIRGGEVASGGGEEGGTLLHDGEDEEMEEEEEEEGEERKGATGMLAALEDGKGGQVGGGLSSVRFSRSGSSGDEEGGVLTPLHSSASGPGGGRSPSGSEGREGGTGTLLGVGYFQGVVQRGWTWGQRRMNLSLPIFLALLWSLFIAVYYLSNLTFQVVGGVGVGGGGEEGGSSSTLSPSLQSFCGLSPASSSSSLPPPLPSPSPPHSPPTTQPSCPGVGDFLHSGGHLVLAEIFSLLIVSCVSNLPNLGRKWTLSLSFALASTSAFLALIVSPALTTCSGTLPRFLVEFLVRASVAGAGQSLFLFTVEASPTSSRGTAAGMALAAFRLGALLTLASTITPGVEGRLEWSTASLRAVGLSGGQFWGGSGVGGGSGGGSFSPSSTSPTTTTPSDPTSSALGGGGASASDVIVTEGNFAAMAACAQLCLLAACLCACLPVDTKHKALRDSAEQEFVNAAAAAAATNNGTVAVVPGGGGVGGDGSGGGGGVGGGVRRWGRRFFASREAGRGGGGVGGRRGTWEPLSVHSPGQPSPHYLQRRSPSSSSSSSSGEVRSFLHFANTLFFKRWPRRGVYHSLTPYSHSSPPPGSPLTPYTPTLPRVTPAELFRAEGVFCARALRGAVIFTLNSGEGKGGTQRRTPALSLSPPTPYSGSSSSSSRRSVAGVGLLVVEEEEEVLASPSNGVWLTPMASGVWGEGRGVGGGGLSSPHPVRSFSLEEGLEEGERAFWAVQIAAVEDSKDTKAALDLANKLLGGHQGGSGFATEEAWRLRLLCRIWEEGQGELSCPAVD